MRAYRLPLILLAAAMLCSPAVAQNAGAAQAPAEDVLTRIPGDALGFVATKNLGAAGGAINTFLADAGLGAMFPGDMLQMIKFQMMMGEGINDNGGMAFVVLDPTPLGWDLPAMASGQAPQPSGPPPVAVLIPGADPMQIFAEWQPRHMGDHAVVSFRGSELFCRGLGGYTVASPSVEVLNLATGASSSMASTMGAKHKAHFNQCAAAMYVNFTKVAPIYAAGMEKAAKEMRQMAQTPGAAPEPLRPLLAVYGRLIPMYKDVVKQLDASTTGLRFRPTGIVLDQLTTYVPESSLGTMVAGMTVRPQPLLDKLPSLPYVLAFGGSYDIDITPEAKKEMEAWTGQWFNAIFGADEGDGKLDPAARDELNRIWRVFYDQLKSVQMVLGGAPADNGVFGLSFVMKAADTRVLMNEMPKLVDAKNKMIRALFADNADMAEMELRYMPAVGTVEGVEVAAIEITHPELANLTDEESDDMMKVLGEDRIRFHVAAVDGEHLVCSFGGRFAFLAEAIKAARTGGPLANDPGVAAAMTELPAKPMALGVVSLPNLLTVVKAGVGTLADPEDPQAQQMLGILNMLPIRTQTPVAMGASMDGPAVHQAVYVPSSLIGEIAQAAMMMASQRMQMGPPPAQNGF